MAEQAPDPATGIGTRLIADGWPAPQSHKQGLQLQIAQAVPGNVRHDILVDKAICGKLIGKSGAMAKELTETSGAQIFILSEDMPPGAPPEKRLVVVVGQTVCVMQGVGLILNIIENTNTAQPFQSTIHQNSQPLAAGLDLAPLPPQDPNSPFQCHPSGWPPAQYEGGRIRNSQAAPGAVRHDVLIHKDDCGRVIGKNASMYKELTMKTGCAIYVLDKEAPPTESADVRLIIMIGSPEQVSTAVSEVTRVLDDAKRKQADPSLRGQKRGFEGMPQQAFGGSPYGAPPPQQYAAPFGAPPAAMAPPGINPAGGLHGLDNPAVMQAASQAYSAGVTPEALQLYAQLVALQGPAGGGQAPLMAMPGMM